MKMSNEPKQTIKKVKSTKPQSLKVIKGSSQDKNLGKMKTDKISKKDSWGGA